VREIKYVRELYRHGISRALFEHPCATWEAKWRSTWHCSPPFTYWEFKYPQLAIYRVGGDEKKALETALEIWKKKVEPKYTSDPHDYPSDWEWRRLFVWDHDKGKCCHCLNKLDSPIKQGVHGDINHTGERRSHLVKDLQLLCRPCHLKYHNKEAFQDRDNRTEKFCFLALPRAAGFPVRAIMLKEYEHLVNVGDVLDIVGTPRMPSSYAMDLRPF